MKLCTWCGKEWDDKHAEIVVSGIVIQGCPFYDEARWGQAVIWNETEWK